MRLPAEAWNAVEWREGSNQPLSSRFAAARIRPRPVHLRRLRQQNESAEYQSLTLDESAKWGCDSVEPISDSQWNEGLGPDSGPSLGQFCRRALRSSVPSTDAVCYVRNTSTPAVRCGAQGVPESTVSGSSVQIAKGETGRAACEDRLVETQG